MFQSRVPTCRLGLVNAPFRRDARPQASAARRGVARRGVRRHAACRDRCNEADSMAQNQSAQDAVSAAMSAIEDALNLTSDDDRAGAPPSTPAPPPASANLKTLPVGAPSSAAPSPTLAPPPPKAPSAQEQGESPLLARRQTSPADDLKPTLGQHTPPANDDRPAIGPIVQALQSRRSS